MPLLTRSRAMIMRYPINSVLLLWRIYQLWWVCNSSELLPFLVHLLVILDFQGVHIWSWTPFYNWEIILEHERLLWTKFRMECMHLPPSSTATWAMLHSCWFQFPYRAFSFVLSDLGERQVTKWTKIRRSSSVPWPRLPFIEPHSAVSKTWARCLRYIEWDEKYGSWRSCRWNIWITLITGASAYSVEILCRKMLVIKSVELLDFPWISWLRSI